MLQHNQPFSLLKCNETLRLHAEITEVKSNCKVLQQLLVCSSDRKQADESRNISAVRTSFRCPEERKYRSLLLFVWIYRRQIVRFRMTFGEILKTAFILLRVTRYKFMNRQKRGKKANFYTQRSDVVIEK